MGRAGKSRSLPLEMPVSKRTPLSTITEPRQGGIIDALERAHRPLTASDVATFFGVTPGCVYRLSRRGVIPSFKFGGSLLFNPQKLAQLIRCSGGAA
jgi:hypothetical protein